MIRIESDYGDLEREITRLERLADDPRSKAALDSALEVVFQQTQEDVHVDTGSLRGSGERHSWVDGDEWKAEISYGGVSSGPIPYVRYAGIERDRGGSHDFLRNTHLMADTFETAVSDALAGE